MILTVPYDCMVEPFQYAGQGLFKWNFNKGHGNPMVLIWGIQNNLLAGQVCQLF